MLIFFFLYLSFEKERGQIKHEGQGCLQTLEIQKGNRRRARKETVLYGSETLESKHDGHRIIFILYYSYIHIWRLIAGNCGDHFNCYF